MSVGTSRQATARRTAGFWLVAAVLAGFLAAAAAPTPVYGLYAARWHFGPAALTAVFAVYALALLGTLLVAGALSDGIGRRPVILAGLLVQLAAMACFLAADGLAWLFLARVLQGVATGLVTAAVAAALLDLQPPQRPGLGPLVNAVTPTFGLAAGALLAGALVQYGPAPLRLTYLVLLVLFAALATAVTVVPETSPRTGVVNFHPRVGIDPGARAPFVAALPGIVAAWAVGGLYLSLGPTVVLTLADSRNRLLGGVFVAVLCVAGGVGAIALRGRPPATGMQIGCLLLAVAAAATIIAVATTATWLLFLATAVGGVGFGTAFLGAFRLIAAAANPERRGEVVAAVYVAAYLAFSVPALVAGLLIPHLGLRTTTVLYSAAVLACAAAATIRRPRA